MGNKYNLNVIDHYPAKNSIVAPDTDIKVKISSDIKQDSLNKETFKLLLDGKQKEGELSYNPLQQEIIFVPNENLKNGLRYKVEILGVEGLDEEDKLFYEFSFKINELSKVPPPEIIKPEKGSIVEEALIEWEDLDVDFYILEIANDYDFKDIVLSTKTRRNSFRPKLEKNNPYYCRVKAYDDDQIKTEEKEFEVEFLLLNHIKRNLYNYNIEPNIKEITQVYDSYQNNYKIKEEQINLPSQEHEVYLGKNNLLEINIPDFNKDRTLYIDGIVISKKIENDFSDSINFFYEDPIKEDFDDLFKEDKEVEKPLEENTVEIITPVIEVGNIKKVSLQDSLLIKLPEVIEEEDIELVEVNIKKQEVFKQLPESIEDFSIEIKSYKNGSTVLELDHSLKENSKYFITIETPDDFYTLNFQTIFSPFYSTIKRVLSGSLKTAISEVDTSQIEEEIYFNSVKAYEIAERADNLWEEGERPAYADEFVTKQTQYNLLKNSIVLTSTTYDEVRIADFSIKAGEFSNISDLLDDLLDEIEDLINLLKGDSDRPKIKSFLKGQNHDPYPLSNRELKGFE